MALISLVTTGGKTVQIESTMIESVEELTAGSATLITSSGTSYAIASALSDVVAAWTAAQQAPATVAAGVARASYPEAELQIARRTT